MTGPAAGVERWRNVLLIGPRGSGKTSVARALAADLGWAAVDTDERIEAREGRSVRRIFSESGEIEFRRVESDVLAEVCRGSRQVVSTGGGIVLAERNRELIRRAGFCALLIAPTDVLLGRIAADATSAERRPGLMNLPPREEIERTLDQRRPLYLALAHVTIDTGPLTVQQASARILDAMRSGAPRQEPAG